ncbi:hypothetical protein BpHYR1_037735 [Brachionus plicatilis]|uniref:Uncharacterized protein n=1 Tax=Brachionus plicatilis TaxID=10195 RepID=A0A3M7SB60_BRAPC|nr:hypothetical protein BpHYR1_037735 [Brachionus plicatilis]
MDKLVDFDLNYQSLILLSTNSLRKKELFNSPRRKTRYKKSFICVDRHNPSYPKTKQQNITLTNSFYIETNLFYIETSDNLRSLRISNRVYFKHIFTHKHTSPCRLAMSSFLCIPFVKYQQTAENAGCSDKRFLISFNLRFFSTKSTKILDTIKLLDNQYNVPLKELFWIFQLSYNR